MDSPIVVSLAISVIGMTLLFLALLLFYFMLTLLAWLARERSAPERLAASPEAGSVAHEEELLQAAVLGVALARAYAQARAEPDQDAPHRDPVDARRASPWWALHHAGRLSPGSPSRRPT